MQPQTPGDARKNWASVLGMILGILSIVPGCCYGPIGLILGAAGIVFSIIGMKSQKKGMSIAGIICGAIGAFWGIFYILALLFGNSISDNMPDFYDNFESEFGKYFDIANVKESVRILSSKFLK